ncbi:protein translocase subunit SecF [candidate division KSB1 bacterium]|nr:protein translocase subunit SecF [candidate division KSB1 bacterium]
MEFFRQTNINFIGARKFTYVFSAVVIIVGIAYIIINGGPNYGTDFTGGTSMEIRFSTVVTPAQIRDAISDVGFGDAEIKRIGEQSENTYLIRIGQMAEGVQTADIIQTELTKLFGQHGYEILSVTQIGPKIGGELRRAALYSVVIALIGLLIYISWRFEFKFAVGAIIALFHDVIATLGIFTIVGMEFSLTVLAAFLTIVGYSINDTIVVYDRIRENLKVIRRENLTNVMNISVNQTLSRTLLTGVSTLVVLLVLFFMGGEVIHGFSFALFIGTLFGTYSSVYVASVIALDWQLWQEKRKSKRTAARAAR